MEQENIITFFADINDQTNQIKKNYSTLEKKMTLLTDGNITPELVDSIGYWLHNLYCAYEDLFKIVASFFENNLSTNGGYHKTLLKRMRMNIEGVRPALLSEENFRNMDELRGFRHVFRHTYSYGLDDDRVAFLLRKVMKNKKTILNDIETFKQKVNP
jgi:uncharacterized protein YutE (UPF0331/DUF86 family)